MNKVLETTIQNRAKVIDNFIKGVPYKISDEKLNQLKENLEFFKQKLRHITI